MILNDYPDYKVTFDGKLLSLKGRGGYEKELKGSVDKNGYLTVKLWDKGKGKTFRLHRIIAEVLIANPDNLPQVNHIDGDKANPSLDNLEWVTNSENQIHAVQNYLQKRVLTDEEVIGIFNDHRVQEVIAKHYGVTQSLVSRIKTGKRWSHLTKEISNDSN